MKNLKSTFAALVFCLVSINAMAVTKDYTSIKVTDTVAWLSSRLSDIAIEMCAGQEGGFESPCLTQNMGPVYELQNYESMRIGHKQPAYSLEKDLLPGQVDRNVHALLDVYDQFRTIENKSLNKSQQVRAVFTNYMQGVLLTKRQYKKLRREK